MPPRVPALPPLAPRKRPGPLQAFGRFVLRLGGWTIVGDFPNLARLVIVVAPHSSAWDGIWGLAAKLAMGVDVIFMGKAELFRGPTGWVLGPLLRFLGGFPVDRRNARGVVEQATARIHRGDRGWLVLAPEGTRRHVTQWKSGFWRIARAAEVPVLCIYFHYPEREIGIGPVFEMSDDLESDMARIRAWYRPWQGKRRGTV
jgi:1-acyl-sn-glycerol-3-phosphate acyltransferase